MEHNLLGDYDIVVPRPATRVAAAPPGRVTAAGLPSRRQEARRGRRLSCGYAAQSRASSDPIVGDVKILRRRGAPPPPSHPIADHVDDVVSQGTEPAAEAHSPRKPATAARQAVVVPGSPSRHVPCTDDRFGQAYRSPRREQWGAGATTVPVPTRPDLVPRARERDEVWQEGERTILRRYNGRGGHQEFEVWDAGVPSNNVYNSLAAQRRAVEGAEERMVEQQLQLAAEDAASAHHQKMEEATAARRESQRRDFEEFRAVREQEVKERRRREKDDEEYFRAVQNSRNQLFEEADRRLRAEKREQKSQWRSELDGLVAVRRERGKQRAEEERAMCDGEMEIGAKKPLSPRFVESQRAALREAWRVQLDGKAERGRADLELERDFAARQQAAAMRCVEEEKQAARARRQARGASRGELLAAASSRRERERAEQERQRDIDRRNVEAAVSASEREKAAASHAKAALTEERRRALVEQIIEKASRRRGDEERERELAAQRTTAREVGARRTLFRCPETNRLLPPEHFNVRHTKPQTRASYLVGGIY